MFKVLRDFLVGFAQGWFSNVLLFLERERWNKEFGDSQYSPIDGNDGSVLTKVKYLGRVSGAGCLANVVILLVILAITAGAKIIFHW